MTSSERKPARLFVAVWPGYEVSESLEKLVNGFRSSHEGVRWEPPERWHITLSYLGLVDIDRDTLVKAMDRIELAPTRARVGPEVRMLGRGVLCVPVTGLDIMAAAVREVTDDLVEKPETRPFYGHITLARLRGRRRNRRRRTGLGFVNEWVGTPFSAEWDVDYVDLLQSVTRSGSSRPDYLPVHSRKL